MLPGTSPRGIVDKKSKIKYVLIYNYILKVNDWYLFYIIHNHAFIIYIIGHEIQVDIGCKYWIGKNEIYIVKLILQIENKPRNNKL